MRAIVRDYSRPGDLVCDPCAGLATTGVAALGMGRRFVASEVDPEVCQRGNERLAQVVPVELFRRSEAQHIVSRLVTEARHQHIARANERVRAGRER